MAGVSQSIAPYVVRSAEAKEFRMFLPPQYLRLEPVTAVFGSLVYFGYGNVTMTVRSTPATGAPAQR
jgi:hypothetical protein